ncbi:PepSY-associated TM helix domain-containing protein [Nitrobacter sp. TKz-YC01]|uniref:PepSY-associated TM helix domain-containing protein n=1 Tax=Nitrobacter sp. TKz-YC01 TaxID=3398703 RepID=UPI003A0FE596
MDGTVSRKTSGARLWFVFHGWLALPIWAFLFFVCLTGSIATVSHEIVWLANPEVRANAPSADARLLSYDEIMAAVEREEPGARVRFISRPVKSIFALTVAVTRPNGSSSRLYVNPYTGAVQGEQGAFDFRRFVRALHAWLLMPFDGGFPIGWYAVSALSIPLLGSLITGIVVYKRFWRVYLRPRLRVSKGRRIFWGDLHRLAGAWSIPFIAIMAVTGGWFLIQAILGDNHISISTAGVPPVVSRSGVPVVAKGAAAPRITLEQAAEAVRHQLPDLDPSFVQFPSSAYDHISVGGRGNYPLIFESVDVNPYNGKVERTRRVSDRSALELVTGSMRPLHTGDFAGIWLKLVYLLFGLALTTLVFSGMMVWTKRTAIETVKIVRERRQARLGLEAAE